MLIDHVNKALIYPNLNGGILLVISDIFDVLGRIAFPIFMFLLIEGYFRTTNRWKYLGIEKYVTSKNNKITSTGVINALAYTPYGGEILRVSSTCYKGDKDIIVTGLLGESMKESVSVALSYIKTNYKLFNIDYKMFDNDFHIHFESGSIPKDGPSAGITIITSILSTLTDKVIDSKISMTGEVTLRGDILPIGGLKEKLIAASQNNINIVFIPKDNIKDLEDIDVELQEKIKIIPVSNYMEIYKKIF